MMIDHTTIIKMYNINPAIFDVYNKNNKNTFKKKVCYLYSFVNILNSFISDASIIMLPAKFKLYRMVAIAVIQSTINKIPIIMVTQLRTEAPVINNVMDTHKYAKNNIRVRHTASPRSVSLLSLNPPKYLSPSL